MPNKGAGRQWINQAMVPRALSDLRQWVLWKTIFRDGKPTKVPFSLDGNPAKSNDPATWSTFADTHAAYRRGGTNWSGIGFVFREGGGLYGIDLDGCRDAATGKLASWATDIILQFGSYSEVSPSGSGVKLFCRGKLPGGDGRKCELDKSLAISEKAPGIELYGRLRYFAVTGMRLKTGHNEPEQADEALAALIAKHWPVARLPLLDGPAAGGVGGGPPTLAERARRYVATMPPAISGSRGHDALFKVACVLKLGFELTDDESLAILAEYNVRCDPPWSERELRHKIQSSASQGGPRGYLVNAKEVEWERVRVPRYRSPPPQAEPKDMTLLAAASEGYLESLATGGGELFEIGIGDVDYAMGGGMALGEMVLLAARPSHGKTAMLLQALDTATRAGIPSLMISKEMGALALGKRTIHFASDLPEEHWKTTPDDVRRQMACHFGTRAPCYVAEYCASAVEAAVTIETAVKEHGVKAVAIDYAQMLDSPGRSRYEQVTQTSLVLKKVAVELNVVLLVAAQLNREIESRPDKNRKRGGRGVESGMSYMPRLRDIRDSGQLEQDADVVLFLVWPIRVNGQHRPIDDYFVFVAKNRNRAINQVGVRCRFLPTRQMVLHPRPGVSSDLEEMGLRERDSHERQYRDGPDGF